MRNHGGHLPLLCDGIEVERLFVVLAKEVNMRLLLAHDASIELVGSFTDTEKRRILHQLRHGASNRKGNPMLFVVILPNRTWNTIYCRPNTERCRRRFLLGLGAKDVLSCNGWLGITQPGRGIFDLGLRDVPLDKGSVFHAARVTLHGESKADPWRTVIL